MRLVRFCVRQQDRIVVHFVRVGLAMTEIAAGLFAFALYRSGAESRVRSRLKEKISPAEPALAGEIMILQSVEQVNVGSKS